MTSGAPGPRPSPREHPPWGPGGRFSDNLFVPIRLGLALLVIFSHSYPICYGTNAHEPLMISTGESTLGDVSVSMFLAISGFLVARSREASASAGEFLFKRVLRIYPGFAALMAFQAFVLAPLACAVPFAGYTGRQLGLLAFEVVDLVGYGFPYGGLPTPFPDNPHPSEINGSLWTIRYEFLCYLLLAVGGRAFRRARPLAACFAVMLTAYAAGWRPPWHWTLTAAFGAIGPWSRLLTFFLAGVLFYRLRGRVPHDSRLALLAAALILAVTFWWPRGLRVVLPTAGVYLLFWTSYHPTLLRMPRPFTGDISYGTYLYAFPIQQSVMLWVSPHLPMNPHLLALISASLSLAAGVISWRMIEERFLKLKPGRRTDAAGRPERG